ncbi:MAG: hypothetical protein COZ70_07160 [Deltaproteobacteria bacterium CG_4_8_14_3_um_filter_51_11]|nr:MAG: hypothetical protein AUK25_03380 [Desulfobacteraceae bacterium CG2_30_51_40]PIX19779.1 MAG: hypothetical protein COZ70_07160 [Deltaproteobacteria bacterium CG_4_8_14_3_um_filter_51_11]
MESDNNSARGVKERLDEPLYNSRLAQNYLEYVRKFYPGIDLKHLTAKAGLNLSELEDSAHWLTQRQMDSFNLALALETQDNSISREVGRFSAFSHASGVLRQYLRRFLTPIAAYWMVEKISSFLTKATANSVRKLGRNKVEISVAPLPGVTERPYQCQNRLGMFEALAKVFTGKFATVEHPVCYHKQGDKCVYIVSFDETPSIMWRLIRNYSLVASVIIPAALFHFLALESWLFLCLAFSLMSLSISIYSAMLEKKELSASVEKQGDSAKALLDEMRLRYDNAMLVQEIGHATLNILDIQNLLKAITETIARRLDFDRGMILLADTNKESLIFGAGFGYNSEQEESLKKASFSLNKPESKGLFVESFREQKPFLIRDINKMEEKLSPRSLDLAREMGVQSMICVPIVYEYEKESLGIIAVDNIKSKRPLTQSDMGLLRGIAAQMAVSLINARSFQRLQTSEKKYRDLVENASSIILRLDPEGRITFFNKFAQKLFDYREEEIVGKGIDGTIFPEEMNRREWISELIYSFQSSPEGTAVREESHQLKSGEDVTVSWIYKPIYDADGSILEILCIGIDITRLKKAELENKELETQLYHSQRMEAIGTLAGGIAHDFNNILSAIIGYTELALYVSKDEAKKRHQMEEVLKAGQRARDLVRQILSFSRHTDQERQPIEMQPIIKEALKMLRASLPATIEIAQDIEPEPCIVLADPTQVHQVIMNLCTNANHAMRKTGGQLKIGLHHLELTSARLRSYPELKEGDYIRMSVSDTGHGMDKATMERIFEPYFTTKEKGVGTGLGLAVVHGIVKGYGGAIRVKSKEGKGTTFEILFPSVNTTVESSDENNLALPGGNERILLVDDESAIVEIGCQMLESMGYSVEASTDPIDALSLFQSDPYRFDLVITDMTMPHMTGDHLAERILSVRPEIPVILCTGYSENLVDEAVKSMGIKEVVTKPLVIGELASIVRKALQ